jgi:hypothetical protein
MRKKVEIKQGENLVCFTNGFQRSKNKKESLKKIP